VEILQKKYGKLARETNQKGMELPQDAIAEINISIMA
jgi:hypothetical protein